MRLFVALNFDPEVRARWHAATAPLRDAAPDVRWTAPDRLHLTLAFLGEQPESVVPPLATALDSAGRLAGPLTLAIDGVGAFPGWRRPRVVWLGIAESATLASLASAVGDVCRTLALPTEARAFHPHITLGRVGDRLAPAAVHTLTRAAAAITVASRAESRSVDLMVSLPGPGGVRYHRLHAAPLLHRIDAPVGREGARPPADGERP